VVDFKYFALLSSINLRFISLWARNFPVFRERSNIVDDFSVVRPSVLNSFGSTNTSATRIASRTEPMVLRSTSSSSTDTSVSGAIYSVTEDVFSELRIV